MNFLLATKHLLIDTINTINDFFKQNLIFLTFYTLLPSIWVIFSHNFGWPNVFIHSIALCYLVAVIICITGCLIRKIAGELYGKRCFILWHILCHLIIYIISFIDIYLYFAFGMVIKEGAIMLFLQTNPSEASQFLQTYILQSTFILILLTFTIIGLAEYLLIKYKHKLRFIYRKWITILCLIYLLCGIDAGVHAINIFSKTTGIDAFASAQYYRGSYSSRRWNLTDNMFIRMYYGFLSVLDNIDNTNKISEHINDTRLQSQSNYNGNIILIIGESHNKRHSSLYGYDKATNPLLESIIDSLYVFQDVITPMNVTHVAFTEFLSVSSLDSKTKWYEATLFPAVFKDAGWNVVFCSNQIKDSASYDIWTMAVDALLNSPNVSQSCFTTRNKSIFKYDGEMVDSFMLCNNKDIELNKPTLYILNFHGQHISYKDCCPDNERFFSLSDYNDRSKLSDSQKQDVADYDNACRYNDKQIYKLMKSFEDEDAIVIYMSDHGEEVHDYRDHFGRSHDLVEYAPDSFHYQMDVPFIIYLTESYRQKYPEKVKLIGEAVNRPFMTDDLCHILFWLGDINTEWYDPTRNLFHPDFNTHRTRVLYTGDDYDKYASMK